MSQYKDTQPAPNDLLTTVMGGVDGSGIIRKLAVDSSGNLTATVSPGTLATSANQTTMITDLGGVTETAPASDTASSGLNGRLQRIAQRLSSLILLVPAALTGSGNFKAAVSEDTAHTLGSGTTDASTQRVVLATNVSMPTVAISAFTRTQIAFGSVTSSYTTGLSNANKLKYLRIENALNVGLFVSFDGVNDHHVLTAGQTKEIFFGQCGGHHAGNVSIKATSAGSGTVTFEGFSTT